MKYRTALTAAVFAALATPSALPAQDANEIAALRQQIEELKALVTAQNQRITQLEQARAVPAPPVPAPAQEQRMARIERELADVKRDTGAVVVPKSKIVDKITISGRIQPQLDFLTVDLDDNDGSGDKDESDNEHFHIRRLYFGATADFGSGWAGILNTNFGGGGSQLEKALIEKEFSDALTASVGYTKVPFGFEENTSSSKIKSVERSVGTRFFNEGSRGLEIGSRHTGVHVSGDLGSGFNYAGAVTNSDKGEADEAGPGGDTNKPAFYGRLQHSSDVAGGKLTLGGDLNHVPDGNARAHGAGGNQEGDVMGYGLHANFARGPLTLTAEVLGADVENGAFGNDDADPLAFFIQPAYRLNDKWELVARYANLDTDGHGTRARDVIRRAPDTGNIYDEVDSYYLGANYFIRGNDIKLSFGYEYAELEDELAGSAGAPVPGGDEEDISGFRVRMQVLF